MRISQWERTFLDIMSAELKLHLIGAHEAVVMYIVMVLVEGIMVGAVLRRRRLSIHVMREDGGSSGGRAWRRHIPR